MLQACSIFILVFALLAGGSTDLGIRPGSPLASLVIGGHEALQKDLTMAVTFVTN